MKVSIQMYHNDPPIPRTYECSRYNVWMHVAWRSHEAYEILEIALPGLNDDEVDELHRRVFQERVKDLCEGESEFPRPTYEDDEVGFDMDWFVLMGTRQELMAAVLGWAADAQGFARRGNVSGDDTYYDYFPDYIDGLRQLCVSIDHPDPHDNLVRWLTTEGPYKDANGDPEFHPIKKEAA